MNRKTKDQLILPTILVLAGIEKIFDDYNIAYNGVLTGTLKEAVISGIKDKLSPEDLEQTKSRKDRRIDQTFRNLISHKTLLNLNFIKISDNNKMRLSDEGFKFLFNYFNKKAEEFSYDLFPDFNDNKRSLYNQLNSGFFPVHNEYLEKLNADIREIIRKKVENKIENNISSTDSKENKIDKKSISKNKI